MADMHRRVVSHSVKRVVSGGQTGVDRAALDVAISLEMDHGGWCPRGRVAEDGVIPSHYNLTETESKKYHVRTQQNVIDSDGTLILYCGELSGGTQLTHRLAKKHGVPCLLVKLDDDDVDAPELRKWLTQKDIEVLNVAGPRESSIAGVYQLAREFLLSLFKAD